MQTQQITVVQARNLVALWDNSIADAAQAHWSENGGEIVEYEEAFEQACWDYGISEGLMNEALEMLFDGLL